MTTSGAPGRRTRPALAQHAHGVDEVVHRHADGAAVELAVGERQHGPLVQVVHHERVQARVGAQLDLVHPEPDHAPVLDLGRQVADPARHEVEEGAAAREALAVDWVTAAMAPSSMWVTRRGTS